MRLMDKNKRMLQYANFIEKKLVEDDKGRKTGNYTNIYSDKIDWKVNYIPYTSAEGVMNAGVFEDYDYKIVTQKLPEGFNDQSVCFLIDSEHSVTSIEPFLNYFVVKIKKNKGSVK